MKRQREEYINTLQPMEEFGIWTIQEWDTSKDGYQMMILASDPRNSLILVRF